jgi:tetratricopeptide (TPR) repeat protein/transcriptional regulator with XRE-family HTH domain
VAEKPLDFAGLLRKLRVMAALTQEELAEEARLGVNTVGDLERGRHPTCHRETAQRLAGALGLTEPVRSSFIAAARGLAPPAAVLPARQEEVPPETSPQVRYSLLPDAPAFTGRDDELASIMAAVTRAAGTGGVVAIHAIDGMPGVGKTTLAVHVAHQLKDRFPDRQLFIDLHAHTPGQDPLSVATALAGLLAATGVDPRYLPEGAEARAGLWRDRMAGQCALLVLDNAGSSSQVAPLLPGGKDCLVLVTSRRRLGDLPGLVIPVPVEVLPPHEAQQMFLRLAVRASAGPDVTTLAELAGYLPLAISLLARVFVGHPSWTLADLIGETRAGLLTLAAENNTVAAAFALSYRYLTPPQQQFLRRLGLHPGTTIEAYAAAALAGTGPAEAAAHLDVLHREGLLTEISYRRYGMHDLIRRYSQEHAATDPAPERARARDRLLDFYTRTARTLSGSPALAWARAERVNLFRCLDYVTGSDQRARVVELTAALTVLLERDGPWAEALARHTTAARAARLLGDRPGQANALKDLGVMQRITGQYPEAAATLEEALAIYRDLGDRPGQAAALNDLGVVQRITGKYPDAAATLEEALAIYRDLGDRRGQASAAHDLGALRRMTGNMTDSTSFLEEALAIYRDLGDRPGQAAALNYLGVVRRISGNYSEAAAALEEALAIHRDLGDRLGQANTLNDLAEVWRIIGDYPQAAAAPQEALSIYRDLGSRLGEANAQSYLGVVRRMAGKYQEAAAALDQALAIYRDLGDRGGEVEILNEEGTLALIQGDLSRASDYHQQALDLAHAISVSWDEACALAGLGRCALAEGHAEEGRDLLCQAQEIFQRIGAAEARDLASELAALPLLKRD